SPKRSVHPASPPFSSRPAEPGRYAWSPSRRDRSGISARACSTWWRAASSRVSRPNRPSEAVQHEEPSRAVSLISIRTLGDPVLKMPARDVEDFDDALARLAEDMFETMYAAPGVG